MKLSAQKQTAIDKAVRAVAGKHAVVRLIGSRYSDKKSTNYQLFLLDNGHTVFCNLDRGTTYLSPEVNKLQVRREEKRQAKAEKRLAAKKSK